jgi:hypothetical protein
MIKEFYKKILPSTGIYCIADINPATGKTTHKFVESVDEIEPIVNKLISKNTNIFVALAAFKGYSRKADSAEFLRSFFVDLDVGENKEYKSKEEALADLSKFVIDNELPPPTRVDSGGGVHAYWPVDVDIPLDEWKHYADAFKQFCINKGLKIDPVVTADPARILRCPDTFNQKSNPPMPTSVMDKEINVYSFEAFKEFLGTATYESNSLEELIRSLPKGGLSEDQKLASGHYNFEANFEELAKLSLEGEGCDQIKYILMNATTLTEPIWRAGLSVAHNCSDGATAIHKMSEGHPGYTREATERKVIPLKDSSYTCKKFDEVNPGICAGCPNFNKVRKPIEITKEFKSSRSQPVEQVVTEVPQVEQTVKEIPQVNINIPLVDPFKPITQVDNNNQLVNISINNVIQLPPELYPFEYGRTGGLYVHSTKPLKEGDKPEKPKLLTPYEVYPLKRIDSTADGECLLIRVITPHDPVNEFLFPIKYAYAQDKFKEIMSSKRVLFDPNGVLLFMNYFIKWGQYLMNKQSAEIMRMQMGWTPGRESFVVGNRELTRSGDTISSPTSPLCQGIAKHLTQVGSYETWKEAANKLNKPSLELHAFTLLTGFGSVLMDYTSTSGVTICLTGESGAAKTGALYANLSVWGNPKDLSVLDATENGMTGRYLGLHNITFGLDEVGNILPKTLSQLIHKISQGKSKIRMQASVNAEREHEMSASMIAVFTSNHSLYDKLTTLKKDPNGEVARLIEFSVHKPEAFAVDANLGREIFDKFRFNYGWAGQEFIFALYKKDNSIIQGMVDKWCLQFKADFGEDTAYRFYENLIAATMTAGEIAVEAGIVKYDIDRVYRRIVGEMIAIRDNVVRINKIDYESVLSDYINKNQGGILAFKDNKIIMEPRFSAFVIRVENDAQMMWISKAEFDKYLLEIGVSRKQFIYETKQAGLDIKVGSNIKKRMNAGWKDLGKSPTSVYAVNMASLSDDIVKHVKTDEEIQAEAA